MEYLCPGAVCFVSPNVQEWDLMKQRRAESGPPLASWSYGEQL